MPASTSASGRLGVTTRARCSSDARTAWTASASSRRSPLLATITGSTTRFGSSSASMAATTASTVAAVASIPVFTASQPMSLDDGLDLGGDELGRHHVNAGHAQRVLRRQRGDRGGAVDPERREGLEVGLDTGPSPGIGPGNCQGPRPASRIARHEPSCLHPGVALHDCGSHGRRSGNGRARRGCAVRDGADGGGVPGQLSAALHARPLHAAARSSCCWAPRRSAPASEPRRRCCICCSASRGCRSSPSHPTCPRAFSACSARRAAT